jgi:hypothetical protein
MQHVRNLRNIAHVQLVRLAVKDIQAERRTDRGPHRDLLPQAAVFLLLLGNHAVPYAPFIHPRQILKPCWVLAAGKDFRDVITDTSAIPAPAENARRENVLIRAPPALYEFRFQHRVRMGRKTVAELLAVRLS